MITRIERSQKLYIADAPDRNFEGALLEVDLLAGEVRLDPLAELTLDDDTKTWRRAALPKGPARAARFAIVHDEENEARHYALNKYTSPLGEAGTWAHPSKRVWALTVGESPAIAVAPEWARPAVTVQLFTKPGGRPAAAAVVDDGASKP